MSRPILDVSRDGGRTWADASLPGLAGDIYVNDTLVEPPTFVGDDGAVAVYAGSTDNPPDIRFYGTRDVGRTWRLTSTFVPGGEDLPTVTVVDPRHFVAIDPISNSVQTSSDEGASWRESASSGLRAPLRLRFWDALHGAAIVQLANGAAPAVGLLRTDDGGVTWIPVAVKSGA